MRVAVSRSAAARDPAASCASLAMVRAMNDAAVPPQNPIGGDLPDPTESIALLVRAQRGDRVALDDLLARYQRRLLRVVRLHLGRELRGHLESVDIVQATNAVAFRQIGDVDAGDEAGLLRWLTRIAIHQIRGQYDYHRAQRRDVRRIARDGDPFGDDDPDGDPRADLAASQTAPPERVARAELREMLDDAVESLPSAQRRVVLLRDYCGWDWTEIAPELDRSVPAAKQLHQRAWLALREALLPRLRGADSVVRRPDLG